MRNKQYALLGAPKHNGDGLKTYAQVLKVLSAQRSLQNASKAILRRNEPLQQQTIQFRIEDLENLLKDLTP